MVSFDNIRHPVLLEKIARRVQDPQVLHLVKQVIKVTGQRGVPQGGPFSPLAANIYLNDVDWAFEAIRSKTAEGPFEAVNYHRFADDSVPRRRTPGRQPCVQPCCTSDEGRPLEAAVQAEASNHPRLLPLREAVVSAVGNGRA